MDRGAQGPLIVASLMGGTAIEEVAVTHPEKIFKVRPGVKGGGGTYLMDALPLSRPLKWR